MDVLCVDPDPDGLGDEDLVTAVRSGDDAALRELLQRYRPLVHGKARTYFVAGGDRQDVVQEGMIGLYKAIRDYDVDRQPCFRPFADLCVTRQVLSAVKAATRQKHGPLNASVSLHAGDATDEDCPDLVERLADERGDPLLLLADEADLRRLREYCEAVLSELEAEVLQRYVAGESYAEIAAGIGRHVKAIDNAVQRIKRKLTPYVTTVREGTAA